MDLVVIVIVAGMVLFSMWTGVREVSLYRKYLQGEAQYFVSRKRRDRRILISFVLLAEAVCLFSGFFIFEFSTPARALFFWLLPLLFIVVLIYLSVLDFRETSKEIDHIFREASDSILKSSQGKRNDSKVL